jgi:hypothetical protein
MSNIIEELENGIKYILQTPGAALSSLMYSLSTRVMNSNNNFIIKFIFITIFFTWLFGILAMSVPYIKITEYKLDPNSGSKFFKDMYAGCHCTISIILLLYIIVKSESFNNKHSSGPDQTKGPDQRGGTPPEQAPTENAGEATANAGTTEATASNAGTEANAGTAAPAAASNTFDNRWFASFVILLMNIPINIRKDFENLISKFKTLEYDGIKYQNEINLGVMFKLVVAHFPIIIFLVVLTSIVSMIKAFHKILCGNTNSGVVIDWPFKIIDIVMYAIFRIVGLIILVKNVFNNKKITFLLSIFYFTAVYLIIRFVLLLYENMFSNTIISLYKWDIRESKCNINSSNENGDWRFDPKERENVRTQQNLKDSSKLTNDVLSLIFNILIILFLSGISIVSASSLIVFSYDATLKLLLDETTTIGRKTINTTPAIIQVQPISP